MKPSKSRLMKLFLQVFAAVFLLCRLAAAEGKDVKVVAIEGARARGEHIAILVGIRDYVDPQIPDLKFTVADTRLLEQELKSRGIFTKFYVLADDAAEKPTLSNIYKKITVIAGTAGENDSLLFFFSGHGARVGERDYLVPQDAVSASLASTSIPTDEISRILRESPAQAQLVILDACRDTGGKAVGERPGFDALKAGKDSIRIVSAKSNQKSWEWDEKKQGVFTYFFVEGLRGAADGYIGGSRDGVVTAMEGGAYARDRVREWSREKSVVQVPQILQESDADMALSVRAEAPVCKPGAARKCRFGDVWSFDSCGEPERMVEQCGENAGCGGDACVCAAGFSMRGGKCEKSQVATNPTECTDNYAKTCSGNAVYWQDSCGYVGSFISNCPKNSTCSGGECVCDVGYIHEGDYCRKQGDCPEGMAYIPPGEFMMGCSPGDNECEANEKPAHEVRITQGFCMDVTEVTQGAYQRVMGSNPSFFLNCGSDCPVELVNWDSAKAYCEEIGKRLPTEAEWEYAARAGTTTEYYWGNEMNDSYAWYDNNSQGTTHPVGQKRPNGYGLYDMLGNVWEWTSSEWGASDCSGCHVLRGGAWYNRADDSRASDRGYSVIPDGPSYYFGFRCARDF